MGKIPWRKNVLFLVGTGYFVVGFIFVFLVCKGNMNPVDAYDLIHGALWSSDGALMALIGGSLAISKDLIPLHDREKDSQDALDPKEKQHHQIRKDQQEK